MVSYTVFCDLIVLTWYSGIDLLAVFYQFLLDTFWQFLTWHLLAAFYPVFKDGMLADFTHSLYILAEF